MTDIDVNVLARIREINATGVDANQGELLQQFSDISALRFALNRLLHSGKVTVKLTRPHRSSARDVAAAYLDFIGIRAI